MVPIRRLRKIKGPSKKSKNQEKPHVVTASYLYSSSNCLKRSLISSFSSRKRPLTDSSPLATNHSHSDGVLVWRCVKWPTWIFEFLTGDLGKNISQSLSDHIVCDLLPFSISCCRSLDRSRCAFVELDNVLQHFNGFVERAVFVVFTKGILLQIIILQESAHTYICYASWN